MGLALAACSVSTKSVKVIPVTRISLAAPDSALLRKCDLPVDLGSGALTRGQLERLWITDRAALLACGRRHGGLAEFIKERDDALRGVLE